MKLAVMLAVGLGVVLIVSGVPVGGTVCFVLALLWIAADFWMHPDGSN